MWIRLLEKSTGQNLETWNQKVARQRFPNEAALRDWLTAQGVTGYARTLLVMEQFGYPDFLVATADQLIGHQYADRPHLRAVYDAILERASGLGEVTVQARKTYVSLVSPRRTFARVQPATRQRVDLGLRLEGVEPGGRLRPSKMDETMRVQISLSSPDEVDDEVAGWLRRAFVENS